MPRYYAIPLILLNKRLAFFEAQCRPDGTPLPLADGSCSLKQHNVREYAYLWRLRSRFLQAVFDMNHERRLDDRWRFESFHGYLYRMYRRYGHDSYQRLAYWRDEIKEGRVPYTKPDITEMDWKAHLLEDMAASTRINAFLWNCVSQGYSRVVKDEPPYESWRAWRRGHRDRKPVLYPTPASSPVGSGLASAAAAAGQTQNAYPHHDVEAEAAAAPSAAEEEEEEEAEAKAETTATSTAMAAVRVSASGNAARCGVVEMSGEADEGGDVNIGHEDVLTTVLTGPSHSQEWALPFPTEHSPEASQATSTSSPGRLRPRKISFKINAPENMELTVIQCTFAHVEDVNEDIQTTLKVTYASRVPGS
ncbi:hypothetical protein BJV74DRAFT_470072 [Russula compacta]|nr:hypothetical protein BJV74DRAFT_470072 [Russula compacta]